MRKRMVSLCSLHIVSTYLEVFWRVLAERAGWIIRVGGRRGFFIFSFGLVRPKELSGEKCREQYEDCEDVVGEGEHFQHDPEENPK